VRIRYCVIPARGGSRRIPGKNIKPFKGRSMLLRAIETAQKTGHFDKIIVSTEDAQIAKVAQTAGVKIHMRPKEFALDHVGTQEVMRQVMLAMVPPDQNPTVCLLYPCTPLVHPVDLVDAHNLLVDRPCSYVVAIAADPLRDIGNFYWGLANTFKGGEPLYNRYTGIYVMPADRAIDINTDDDWRKAEAMYDALQKQK